MFNSWRSFWFNQYARCIVFLAYTRCISRLIIRVFMRLYPKANTEYLPDQHHCLNDFFVRQQSFPKTSFQPYTVYSPIEGYIEYNGQITQSQAIQAKSIYYSLDDLCLQHEEAKHFYQAAYTNLYLAPDCYHRIHMPMSGTLYKILYVPGRHFPLNTRYRHRIPQLYLQNERAVCFIKHEHYEMMIVFVGACAVSGIHIHPVGHINVQNTQVFHLEHPIKAGEELGWFSFGSSILMFMNKPVCWQFETKRYICPFSILGHVEQPKDKTT